MSDLRPCHYCGEPTVLFSPRHGLQRAFNPDRTHHFCHPERLDHLEIDALRVDEVLVRETDDGVEEWVVWEEAGPGSDPGLRLRRLVDGELESRNSEPMSGDDLLAAGYRRTLRLLEEDLPEHSLDTAEGWLAPDGTLYPCRNFYDIGFSDHIRVAGLLEEREWIEDLEDSGYIKLWRKTFTWGRFDPPTATRAQRRTIEDYCLHHGLTLEEAASDALDLY